MVGLFLCMKPKEKKTYGNEAERELFTELNHHYEMAKEDLAQRIIDFDKKDILFRSHIDEKNWPYKAMVFDPRVFTSLYEKTARTFANKPRGRLVPREGGDTLGSHINNEVLSFQWDENERADNQSMLSKWSLMDLNARKYGASFGLAKWRYQKNRKNKVVFDGPDFTPLNNRDCLPNPSYSTIKNWFQHREYLTLQEMELVNDSAQAKPIYKNLDLLRQALGSDKTAAGSDIRSSNYVIKNKSIKGLTDYLGRDTAFKVVEVVTEYRDDRLISFSPRHGVVLRDIDCPFDHEQIPVILLKYYPIDDDIYGLSEIEPVEKLQKAINAIVCQYLDAINMSLYAPLKINSTGGAVQMHTIEFGPGKKWLMQNPSTDVITHDQSINGVQEFTSTYRFLVGAMQEALGDTSQGISNLNPGSGDKTATEVRDLAISRSVRDNFNMMYLGEALKKQMNLWYNMNQQFLFTAKDKFKIIRIVGKDALKYFKGQGLDGYELNDDMVDQLADATEEGLNLNPEDFSQPAYPIDTPQGQIPKLSMEETGQEGNLYLEKKDLSGMYDYIPDLESMMTPNQGQLLQAKQQMVQLALNPTTSQQLAGDGYKLNTKELLEDLFEQMGSKDADKYFEKLPVQQPQDGQIQGQLDPTGAGAPQGMQPGMDDGGDGGLQAQPEAMA